jgi:hypothetical protein
LALAGTTGGLAAAAKLPALDACGLGKPTVRPARVLVACGDGNFYITNLRWSVWSQTGAAGLGAGHEDDCAPSCALGHSHHYLVAVAGFAG